MTWTDDAQDMLRGAETLLFWVGAFAVASLLLWILYRLLSGFRVWVLGNGQLVSPRLGKWAGNPLCWSLFCWLSSCGPNPNLFLTLFVFTLPHRDSCQSC
uniref:Uncharacterized protein n=1 Tax=Hippocampus comes TaxID=109280 RepID=A0A3Q2Y9Y3_HIPCM